MWIDLEDVFCVCVGGTVTKHILFCLFGGCMSFSGGKGWVGVGVGVWPGLLFDLFPEYLHFNFCEVPDYSGW